MNPVKAVILIAATLATGACIREAAIAVPSHFQTAERLPLTGMGGGIRGDFNLAGGTGTFTRSASRLGIMDPLDVRNRGGGSFRFAGAPSLPELAGQCFFQQGSLNAGPVSISSRRLEFHCDISKNGSPAATLDVVDPQPAYGTLHGRSERIGSLVYGGMRIGVKSIHRAEGGGLPSPTALGYMFSLDGREIGAVDLNGPNKTILVSGTGVHREAVIAASIALSTFWDPAEVQ